VVIARALLVAVLMALVAPAGAHAHAVLKDSEPARGATLGEQPDAVTFHFSEPVEAAFGAVRVFNDEGERVDDGKLRQPRGADVGVGLRDGLPEGSYTATYRLVSNDGHPISGGLVFAVGRPSVAPGKSVDELIGDSAAGPVTDVAFGIVRAVGYAAIALSVGGLAFLLWIWLPGLARAAGPGSRWSEASSAYAARARWMLASGAALGVLTSVLGLVLQGANAGRTTFWTALSGDVVGDVLDTRFGEVWGARVLVFLAFGLVAAVALSPSRQPGLRPATLGAEGAAVAGPPRAAAAVLIVLAGALTVSPALSGHPAAESPTELLIPLDAAHVLAMSVWLGGLAALLFAVPAATRRLEEADRTRLLSSVLLRFSPLALVAVIVLVVTGVGQAIVHLTSFGELLDTAFGRAILIKSALLVAIVAVAAVIRGRALPRLTAAADGGAAPGATGRLVRRSLRAEVVLLAVVLGVTSALVSYPPPASLGAGPGAAGEGAVSRNARMGPLRLDVTVDPARAGSNQVHIYLTRASDGAPFDKAREIFVHPELKAKNIGPLDLKIRRAGPGHYVAPRAQLTPAGMWELHVIALITDFDQYEADVQIPVR
jgi:copper transport protein